MRVAGRFSSAAAGVAFAAAALAADPPAATVDPFRFLEDPSREETQAFFREQDEQARSALTRIPSREALRERVRSLARSQATVTNLQWAAGRLFYLRHAGAEAAAVLCVRDGLASPERVLLDPSRHAGGGRTRDIAGFAASPDARHVAYALGRGPEATLHVLAVATGKDLAGAAAGVRFARRIAWTPDGQVLFYARQGSAADPVVVHRHVVGRDFARDEAVFGPGIGGVVGLPAAARPTLLVPLESRFAYAVVRDGEQRERSVYASLVRELAAGKPAWRRIASAADKVTDVEAWRDDLFLISFDRAPNGRVLRLDPDRPVLAHARVAVREGDSTMEEIALARDALYLRTLVGGVDRLERAPLASLGGAAQYVRTPFDHGLSEMVAHPRRPGVLLRLEGWIEPPMIAEVDARTGDLRDTKLHPGAAADFSQMVQVRLYATARDGERIPITLLYKGTTQLTADLPTVLEAYGSHGATPRPRFEPQRLAWLERGGVHAIAHVRGGGEYGERWHAAARGNAKPTTIEDFLAAADFLVEYGFTSPRHLAITGEEEGALPAAGAMVRRPARFAAVFLRSPWIDMLHHESAPDAAARLPEFGSAKSAQDLETLHALSANHLVRNGAAYPALLAAVASRDLQPPPWHAGKLVARLQAAASEGKPALLRVDPARVRAGAVQGVDDFADSYAFFLWQFGDPEFQPIGAIPLAPSQPPRELPAGSRPESR